MIRRFGEKRLLLLFLPICAFFLIYLFLAFAPRVSPKLWPHYQERYFTWTIAGFTYYNNQLVQHMIAMVLAHSLGRKIVSPNFRMSGTEEIVAFNVLFDVNTPTFSHYFHNTSGQGEVNRNEFEKIPVPELTSDSSSLPRVLVPGEDLWDYTYPRFMYYWHFDKGPLIQANKAMPIGGTLKKYIDWYTSLQDGKIGRSIGVHLRSWNPAVSLVAGFECAAIYKHDPRKNYYGCILPIEEIIQNIDFHFNRWAESHNYKAPDIFLATDLDPTSSEMSRLRNHFPTLYTVSDLEPPPNQNDTLALEKKYVPALIDAALLVHTEIFLGNYFSTLSQITAVRREFKNTHLYHPLWVLWIRTHWKLSTFLAFLFASFFNRFANIIAKGNEEIIVTM